MARPQPVTLSVAKNESLTPNMQRLTLFGDALARFTDINPGSYVKLMFDCYGDPLPAPPQADQKTLVRTYTIRKRTFSPDALIIDMALHDHGTESGPASHWARKAKVGERITLGGPGSTKPMANNYDWVLFIGDMTALPAISTYLESLPADTKGMAIIELTSPSDAQQLVKPHGVDIHYLVKGTDPSLPDYVDDLLFYGGTPAVWVACEFSDMRRLRTLLTTTKNVPREQLYISSYWRNGRSEDQHKVDKKNDMDAYQANLT